MKWIQKSEQLVYCFCSPTKEKITFRNSSRKIENIASPVASKETYR